LGPVSVVLLESAYEMQWHITCVVLLE
jgi:hypothetical protein